MDLENYYWYDGAGNSYILLGDGKYIYSNGSPVDPQPDPATLLCSGKVDADGNLYLYFDEQYGPPDNNNSVYAGYPYIVKWTTPGDPIVNPVFTGVKVTKTTPVERSTAEGRDPVAADAYSADPVHNPYPYGNVTFRGSYAPIDYAAADHSILFMGASNTLYYPEAGAHIGPFRAYFELRHGLTCGTPTSNVRAFNLSFGDGSEANGIEEVTAPLAIRRGTRGETWHTLDGRRLSGQPTTKGLFLRNGRKVIVK